MGLFDLFKSKRQKTLDELQELLSLDLNEITEKAEFVSSESTKDGTELHTYNYEFDKPILKTFEQLRFQLAPNNEPEKKAKKIPTVLKFRTSLKTLNLNKIKKVVNLFAGISGDKTENWIPIDMHRIQSKEWRGRSFFFDDFDVFIETTDEDDFDLTILGYDRFKTYFK